MTPNPRLSALLLAVTLALLHIATTARADPPGNQNAALLYWPVMYSLSNNLAHQFVRLHAIESKYDPIELEVATKFVDNRQDIVQTLAAISRLETCDWGITEPPPPGQYLDLPHVSLLSAALEFLKADATLKLERNDHAGAAVSLAASLRIAQHLRAGPANFLSAYASTRWFMESGSVARQGLLDDIFDADDRALIGEAVERSLGRDPFGYRDLLAYERDEALAQARAWHLSGPEGKLNWDRFMMSLEGDIAYKPDGPAAALSKIDPASKEFERQIQLLETAYQALLVAQSHEDWDLSMSEVEKRIVGGAFGPLAAVKLRLSNTPVKRAEHMKAIALRNSLSILIEQY